MIRIAIAALGGACLLLPLDALPPPPAMAALAVAGLAIGLALRRAEPAAFVVALAWSWLALDARLSQRLDPALEGRDLVLRGVVASVPRPVPEGVRLRIAVDAGSGLPPLVELTAYDVAEMPRATDRVVAEARLRRPRGFANPGGTDLEARMLREGIGATGYVKSLEIRRRGWREVAAAPVLVARDAAAQAISAALGERPATGIVQGLAVGLQDALSREQWRELARSGTSHLMAISGMHIGMFALAAAWVARRVQRVRQRRGAPGAARDVAAVAGCIAAFGYSLLAGWSVPTQRTMVMILLAAVALLCRRRVGPADALGAGVLAVLAIEPLAPLASGFWLSFGAVGALMLAGAGLLGHERPLAAYARSQLAVGIGLVPVLAASFGSLSLVAPLVNLLAIPLYTLVIVPGVLVGTALASAMPSLGAVVLAAVAWLIEATWPLIAVPAAWPSSGFGVASLPPWCWSALVCGAVASLLPLPAPGRVAGVAMVVAAALWRPSPPCEGCARFTLLDVGQGLAAVVETRRHVLVYDTGPAFRSGADAGALVVEPFLRSRAIRRVDLLVASHDDADHTGGALTLAALVSVHGRAASGHALDALGTVERCRAGRRWTWDGVEFEWRHPGPTLAEHDNDRSCVLAVRTAGGSLLLTGDVQKQAEQELVRAGLGGPYDVVVVPHHGSRTSSGAPLVDGTRARWALVSAGYRNRWGFPATAVVERWQQSGARVLVSADSGAIELELGPAGASEPAEWRRSRRRTWQDP